MEIHKKALNHLCRVCDSYISSRISKSKWADTSSVAKELHALWNINVWTDSTDVHPNNICSKCLRKVYHLRKGTRKFQTNPSFCAREWNKHPRTGICETCKLYNILLSGTTGGINNFKNRPATTSGIQKLQQIQLPFKTDELDIFSHIHSIFKVREVSNDNLEIDRDRIHPDHQDFFVCSLCLCILTNAVYTECQHSYCSDCLTRLFQFHQDISVPCPVCGQPVLYDSIKQIPNLLQVQLQNLSVYCTKCNIRGNHKSLNDHQCPTVVYCSGIVPQSTTIPHPQISTSSSASVLLSPLSAAAETLNSLAKQHEPGQPIPDKIRQLTDKWTWLRLKASTDRSVQLKTSGMPMTIQQVVKPRKSSLEITKPYLHQRTRSIATYRSMVSMGATEIHLEEELRDISKLDIDSSMAMMRDMQASWQSMRAQRWYLGDHIASEYSMLKRRDELLADNLHVEMIPMVFSCDDASGTDGFVTKPAPMAYVKDLSLLIIDHLDHHDKFGNMTDHDGLIPPTEIWIKVGADKGGRPTPTMKFNFQIVNVQSPNSIDNTVNFGCFEAPDNITNITIAMEIFRHQLDKLKTMTWRNRQFRLLLYGDCEFLCRSYGILGCNALYACPYCEGSYRDWQKPLKSPEYPDGRDYFQKRSLTSLKNNYEEYTDDGSDKKRSKLISKSVVREPLLPVEPEDIVVPTLHLGLGIYKSLYDKLEKDCHNIDLLIYSGLVSEGDLQDQPDSKISNFQQLVENKIKANIKVDDDIAEKEEELEEVSEEIPLQLLKQSSKEPTKLTKDILDLLEKKNIISKKIESLISSKHDVGLQYGKGPVAGSLDQVLQKHKVERQVYHGKTFVGNHINKLCKADPIKDLSDQAKIALELIEESGNDDIPLQAWSHAKQIKTTYEEILHSYADVHYAINKGGNMDDPEINRSERTIQSFMYLFRKRFPQARISLKLHMLEDHTVGQLRRFRSGLGKLNESGGEAGHSEQNRDSRRAYPLQHQPAKRMNFLMKTHLVNHHPAILANSAKKNRKRKHHEIEM